MAEILETEKFSVVVIFVIFFRWACTENALDQTADKVGDILYRFRHKCHYTCPKLAESSHNRHKCRGRRNHKNVTAQYRWVEFSDTVQNDAFSVSSSWTCTAINHCHTAQLAQCSRDSIQWARGKSCLCLRGALKMQERTTQDWKMTDRNWRTEKWRTTT